MKISVIIPAYNEEKLIGETLRHIQAALPVFLDLGWQTELIVCDNNSSDRTAELARAAGALVAFEPINQISRARNAGAAIATGDWFIFIDADSHPSRELFADVAVAIQSGSCLAGGSTVQLEGDYPMIRCFVGFLSYIMRMVHWVAGSFIFCEASAFREIGGFSQELFASEEIDLSQRLKQLARRSRRKIIILHRHPLLTSARKMHLYSPREHVMFLARTVLAKGRTLKDQKACHTWYDGRR